MRMLRLRDVRFGRCQWRKGILLLQALRTSGRTYQRIVFVNSHNDRNGLSKCVYHETGPSKSRPFDNVARLDSQVCCVDGFFHDSNPPLPLQHLCYEKQMLASHSIDHIRKADQPKKSAKTVRRYRIPSPARCALSNWGSASKASSQEPPLRGTINKD